MVRDAWIALAVAAASAVSLWDLWRTPATGAFVKTTTFPMALAALLLVLALLMLGGALRDRARRPRRASGGYGAIARVALLLVFTVLYIVALPWFGYLLSSAVYFGVASLVFGNRHALTIVIAMITVPLALMLFFEKYMIVLLPSARLFG
jgi:hypothetical protein